MYNICVSFSPLEEGAKEKRGLATGLEVAAAVRVRALGKNVVHICR